MAANGRTGNGETGGNGPLRRTVKVVNPLGLHHRVADRFSRAARQFAAAVAVFHGDSRADGKSVWDLMMLVVLPDAEVVVEVDGPDAAAALDPLAAILGSPGGEDYTI
ncbi:HPr family phosphocarrier protein [Urbifossiella limnaea]|uniref:Phosphocarrier protein HPr n=1 Tax=Urbifossiella limnaea TaxID=2528023 RepID=A0A517XTA0_9BACT|nr:HPr family phosphocarrier protein [Urbifossiella limnaea]QDU20756.1 Phosphocarrier protein HPr [Urbifossiella limnaea]